MNIEKRGVTSSIETRESADEGYISGYITVWGTVDDYNSTFVKGCFKKTIEERGGRIKLLDDHGKVIGKVTEIREDDYGCYTEGRLSLSVDRAKDVFNLVKDGVIDTLSFGFRTIKDRYVDGVRNITEVKLYEVSPVTFEANEAAAITSVRSTDFGESLTDEEMARKHSDLTYAIHSTLSDIWWTAKSADELRTMLDKALADFHAAYLEYAAAYVERYWQEDEVRSTPITNEVASEFRKYANGRSLETIAAATPFTVDELRALQTGHLLTNDHTAKLEVLSKELRTAHAAMRREKVETLCAELRSGGFSPAEALRLQSLLAIRGNKPDTKVNLEGPNDHYQVIMDALAKLTL